jgi:hypothetical protein
MGLAVAAGASMSCTFGVAPSTLSVLPTNRVTADGAPMATTLDHQPNVNIAPFGMCNSLANPQVAAATSAAMGTLTPQPCVPMTVSPWTPGAVKVTVGGAPALTATSMCSCTWAGQISISNPGTKTVQAT